MFCVAFLEFSTMLCLFFFHFSFHFFTHSKETKLKPDNFTTPSSTYQSRNQTSAAAPHCCITFKRPTVQQWMEKIMHLCIYFLSTYFYFSSYTLGLAYVYVWVCRCIFFTCVVQCLYFLFEKKKAPCFFLASQWKKRLQMWEPNKSPPSAPANQTAPERETLDAVVRPDWAQF